MSATRCLCDDGVMDHHTLAAIAAEVYDYAVYVIGDCRFIVKYYDELQVVAFQVIEPGALVEDAGWFDMLCDPRMWPWYDADAGWCHSGFLKNGRQAADFLKGVLYLDRPVICTGHSLGGAAALVCAAKLQAAGYRMLEWVGFGAPKVQLTRKHYPFPQSNYWHAGDIVPTLPQLPGYRHNSRQLHLCGDEEPANWNDHHMCYYLRYVP